MSKQKNPNIGHIDCLICGAVSAVRKTSAEGKPAKFYYDCLTCGRITPNHKGGQDKIADKAKIWGASGPPKDIPRWIAENWPYGLAVREGTKGGVTNTPAGEAAEGGDKPQPAQLIAPVVAVEVEDDLPDVPPPPPKKPAAKPKQQPEETDDDGGSFLDVLVPT